MGGCLGWGVLFFFSRRRRHTRFKCDWSSDVCSSDLMTLMIGKGDLLRFSANITRVAVAEPKVADAIVVSPHEVMINAKGIGNTTVMIWEGDESPQRYDVNGVAGTTDLDTFRRYIRAAFPGLPTSAHHTPP